MAVRFPQHNYQPVEQLLFRTTEFGDDVDRPLAKQDGTATYFAADIAYHYDKKKRGTNPWRRTAPPPTASRTRSESGGAKTTPPARLRQKSAGDAEQTSGGAGGGWREASGRRRRNRGKR